MKTYDNVVWLKPEMNFKQVILKYGYPFISKETSCCIYSAKRWREKNKTNPETKKDVKTMQLFGEGAKKGGQYDKSNWLFMVESPFLVGNFCCNVMKKNPIHQYEKETKRKAFTGMMASESALRTSNWLRYGCNAFENKRPTSNPLSFWTEQDVLEYLKKNDIKIASVYGGIVEDWDECDGQTYYGFKPRLKTTGCQRTGCMFCGFGAHLEKSPNRFEMMKETHPTIYKYVMKPLEDGGLGYKEVIDWINEHNPSERTKIKY